VKRHAATDLPLPSLANQRTGESGERCSVGRVGVPPADARVSRESPHVVDAYLVTGASATFDGPRETPGPAGGTPTLPRYTAPIRALVAILLLLLGLLPLHAADTARQIVVKAILEEDADKKLALVQSLAGSGDPSVKPLLAAWKEDLIFLHKTDGAPTIPVLLTGEKDTADSQLAQRVEDAAPLKDPAGKPLRLIAADLDTAAHDATLRAGMKTVVDLLDLSSPDRTTRLQVISTFGMAQEPEKLPLLQAQLERKMDGRTTRALREAIALIQLKDPDPSVQLSAIRQLGAMGSIPSRDFLTALQRDPAASPDAIAACVAAQKKIVSHLRTVDSVGTAFRGISLGSILLVVAIGLAITFGLMGVINMAHGELIVVGAYTTYVVQNLFSDGLDFSPFGIHIQIPGMHQQGAALDLYFVVALPLSFLVAAGVGILLERSVIRFLYRRPLESLLATWGVSLVLQQVFRLVFGANNVQVYSPSFLSGNWTVADIIFGWNRVFVIGFAVLIIIGTHLALTKTPLGLLIRAVMQNRQMAACMGVKTERVNMLTFGFGSGLAGLAGAFLSQIGNVGPSLGQSYIVDAFMTVVVGGVGNIMGTVVSALSIGILDQTLQQILLNPVLGKIVVLGAIILFLQWRPAGLFVTKSRSLEG
jgi:urea transport system permease protein